jgi:hypothetical protein
MTTVPQQLEPALPAIQLSTAGSSSSAVRHHSRGQAID